MVQAAREAQENNETILVIVTTISQILAGMAGFQENRPYTSLQVILYSLSPQKKSPTCLHVQSPAGVHSAERWMLTPRRPAFKFFAFFFIGPQG